MISARLSVFRFLPPLNVEEQRKEEIHRSIKVSRCDYDKRLNARSISNFHRSIPDHAYGYIDVSYCY